jgi:hypothetical protein
MSKSITRIVLSTYLSIVLFTASASLVFAQPAPSTPVRLNNPLRVETISDLLAAILNIVIVLAVPIIVFFIIYAGFLYVTARGNAQQVEQATRSLTYAIIGGVLVLGAVAIAQIIRTLVLSF